MKIIEEKRNYEPAAIEVAQQVLSERKYTDDDLFAAKAELDVVLTKKRNRQERINKINDFVDENFGLDQKTPVRLLNLF